MPDSKPYAFVSYSCSVEAVRACENLQRVVVRESTGPSDAPVKLYLSYIHSGKLQFKFHVTNKISGITT